MWDHVVLNFPCDQTTLYLSAQKNSKLIEIFFTPPQARPSTAEFEVEFVKGVKCYIAVSGTGKNVDVSLSTPTLALEGTYISLVSQKALRIRNHSDIPIKFCWKSFALVEEEEHERDRLLQEINRMERMIMMVSLVLMMMKVMNIFHLLLVLLKLH